MQVRQLSLSHPRNSGRRAKLPFVGRNSGLSRKDDASATRDSGLGMGATCQRKEGKLLRKEGPPG